jgi:ribonucleoside-diphosphate reductase beta chain
MHMQFAFKVIDLMREEEPELFDAELTKDVYEMMEDAIECETMFANDVLAQGVAGLSVRDMRTYLEFVADRRLAALRMPIKYGSKNPFSFLDLQDVQEVTNFFERRVSSYSVGVEGSVAFNEAF